MDRSVSASARVRSQRLNSVRVRFWPWLMLFVAATTGCSDGGSSTTTGRRVALHTAVTGEPNLQQEFTTGTGWKVKLARTAVAVQALYYFDGEPAFTRLSPVKRFFQRVEPWLGISTAYAHPGHYQSGDALGQMLTPSSVDLFAGVTQLADGDGVTGSYRSARFVFDTVPHGSATAELGNHAAVAEGQAVKDNKVVYFKLSADFAEIAHSVSNGEVDGCNFDAADVQGSGTVMVTIKPTVWFNLVDFSDLATTDAEHPVEPAPEDLARVGFVLGTAQLSAYQFSFAGDAK